MFHDLADTTSTRNGNDGRNVKDCVDGMTVVPHITGMVMIPIYLGITVFLLRKKKMDAVFENLKQASEYDRKVSGMNY